MEKEVTSEAEALARLQEALDKLSKELRENDEMLKGAMTRVELVQCRQWEWLGKWEQLSKAWQKNP